ncbi:MAG TPA: ABC transporter permease [Vicinamibacterales bacterium]|nr:ABC transporter permease [Vicinamibacterales bacterium]
MLLKTPVFTAVVVFTLAVGIGANTAMFSIVNGVLLQGLPFQHADRIVDINEVERRDITGGGAIAPATFVDWQRMTTSFDAISVYVTNIYNVTPDTGEPARVRGAIVSSSFFEVLGVKPMLGRGFSRDDAEPGRQNIVLTFGFWQRQFAGNPTVVNQTVRLNGRPYTIVGVMPATLNFPQNSNFWVSTAYDVPGCGGPATADPRGQRGMHCLRGIARLKPQLSLQQANAELKTVSDQLAREYPEESSNFVGIATPLQDRLVGSAKLPLLVLLGAVGCVLLIVVANVANLLMARATVRARELAIRAAIGADRSTLMRQLLTESLVVALVGGGLGVLLAFWGVDLILALDPGEVPRVAPVSVDGWALAFALGLSLITGVLFGVVPAWQASRPDLQNTLKDSTRGSTGDGQRHVARAGLVLAEVSLSLVLLVGAGLLFRSLMTLVDLPMGFTTSRMLTMSVAPAGEDYRSPGAFLAYWERVVERVSAIAGVEKVALTGGLPMGGGMSVLGYQPDNKPEMPANQLPLTHAVDVGPGYFETMGIPVVKGREFSRHDVVLNPRVILINEALARRDFPNEDPIGHRFSFGSDERGWPRWVEIVGVVGNVRQYRADEAPVPITYMPSSAVPSRAQNLMIRTAGDPMSVAGAVRAALQSLDPSLPVSPPRTLDDVIGASLTQRRFNMTLFLVFAGIALILAIAGIYGTVAYSVAQRTQEIGIRVALGATSREILGLVLSGALKPVLGGLAIGVVAAFGLTRLLEGLVYGVSTTDPLTFISLPVLLGVVAFLAGLFPALRATRVDPLDALRVD